VLVIGKGVWSTTSKFLFFVYLCTEMALKVLENGSFQFAFAARTRYIINQQVLNLVYELPEDSTDLSKHLSVVKDHTLMYVSNLYMKFFFLNKY
jgi:hypothetical protein